MEKYTVTDLIDHAQEYKLNSKENRLWLGMEGYGATVDEWDGKEWYEESFICEDFEPLQQDTTEDEVVASYPEDTPLRFHDYKVYLQFTLELPPNRKRGDTYTAQEVRDMLVDWGGWGDDCPKGGFRTYGNISWCGEVEEEEEE